MKNKNGFIRAFWRRIEIYKDDFEKELPEKMPVQFSCAFETASILLRPEWIDAQERLPNPKGEWVLVYADGAQNCIGYTEQDGFHDWCGQGRPGFNICTEQITHWMPLPEAPQES